ncbi:ParA family protein [Pseudomonas sp. P8_250]|uniref:ParA family protein n=1 Tax=Pseudomonas sp. P8_250 TaxID=3043446 RepID=UPI002A3664AD|nr:ParA family protein [Pseudomonas sp. P8_250]MDX9668742.1 ParA family protein [Pseudomonas sp. P8_250]
MQIIAVANGKGGVGKTTTAANLGVNFAKRGYYTMLLDTDPLACLEDWWDERKANDLQLMSIALSQLDEAIPKLREAGVEYLIIDTPGFISNAVTGLLCQADLVLIISKASPLDLRATQKSLKFIEEVKTPLVFVLNEVRKGTRIANEAIMALSQHGRVAPIIHYKNDFVVSMIDGRTLEETADADNPGIAEVDALADYVLRQAGEKTLKVIDRSPVKQATAEVIAISGRRGNKT